MHICQPTTTLRTVPSLGKIEGMLSIEDPASVFLQVQNMYIKPLTFVYNLINRKKATIVPNIVHLFIQKLRFAIFLYNKLNT